MTRQQKDWTVRGVIVLMSLICATLSMPVFAQDAASNDEAKETGLTDESFPKSVPLFGSDWRFSFGGYFKLDMLYDFDGTGDEYQLITATIPVDGAPDSQPGSYSKIHARESRFNFEVRNTREGLPANKAFLEMDFFDENSNSPRLRHAYFQWGHFLAGQTWTNLTIMDGLPFLIDFAYGDSLYGGRVMQIRWEQPLAKGFSWLTGLEDWSSGAIANVAELPGTDRPNLPLFALRGKYTWDRGVFSLGGSLAQLRWDGTDGVDDDTALQWALVVGGRVYLDAGRRHFVTLGGSYGDGSAANIISLAEGGVPNAVLQPDGTLETMTAWNAALALQVSWSRALSSNVAVAWADIDPSPLLAADTMKSGGAVHVNLIWDVKDPFQVGVEYMIGQRVNVDEADGTAHRVQCMAMYSF